MGVDVQANEDDELEFTITVKRMRRRWIPHFLSMLTAMQDYGNMGSSRVVAIYSDGDGDFRPVFEWSEDLDDETPARRNYNGDLLFDAG